MTFVDNQMSRTFFNLLNQDQELRNALKSVINQIQSTGPLNADQISSLISTQKAWINLIRQLGKDASGIVSQKIKALNTDANMRYALMQIIKDIEKNGSLRKEDYELIAIEKVPKRMLAYPPPPARR